MKLPNAMTWVFIEAKHTEGATHFLPRCVCKRHLAESLEPAWAEKLAREDPGSKLSAFSYRDTQKAWLDLGGMALSDRKIYTLEVDGLTLTVPATHVGGYLDMLETRDDRPPESIGATPFYMLPSMHLKVILTLDQCDTLALNLLEISAEADAIASIENDAFNKAMESTSSRVSAPKRPTGRLTHE